MEHDHTDLEDPELFLIMWREDLFSEDLQLRFQCIDNMEQLSRSIGPERTRESIIPALRGET